MERCNYKPRVRRVYDTQMGQLMWTCWGGPLLNVYYAEELDDAYRAWKRAFTKVTRWKWPR
jgi:hypothetical protein